MSNLSPNSEPLDDNNVSCYFSSYIDDNGELLFTAGWGEDPVDLQNFALLLSNISTGKITEQVIEDIKLQCLEADKLKDFIVFEEYFRGIQLRSSSDDDDDDIAIRPLSVSP